MATSSLASRNSSQTTTCRPSGSERAKRQVLLADWKGAVNKAMTFGV